MSNSSLVTMVGYADPSNYTKGRSQKLRGIVIHHAVATNIQSVINTFQRVGRNGSAHYCVCDDQVALLVDESNTAWHCSNWDGNCRTIGIEVCNSTLAPDYRISDASWKTLVRLVAEIAKRNGFGRLQYLPDGDGTGITGHKDWVGASTACPGPFLYPKLAQLAAEANEINYPTLKWVNFDQVRTLATKSGAKLITVATGSIVKEYEAGTSIEFASKATYNGKEYYRSKYSTDNNIDNGILSSELSEIPKPEEQKTDPKPAENAQPAENTKPQEPAVDLEAEFEEINMKGVKPPFMNQKLYETIRWTIAVFLPALGVFLPVMNNAWGWGLPMDAIGTTIQAVALFLGAIFGISKLANDSKQE